MSTIFKSKSGKEFLFVPVEEECYCEKCIFNTMGAEGVALCAESPDCLTGEEEDDGYYILKPTDETN